MSISSRSFLRRKIKVRNKLKKSNRGQRARISVFRSNKNIYAQLINISGNIVHSFSSLLLDEKDLKGAKGIDVAKIVGDKFGKICVDNGVKEVVFDRGSYKYIGRVKALAESCRKAGLKF